MINLVYQEIIFQSIPVYCKFNTLECATKIETQFEIYDGFIRQNILKLCRQESWPFGLNPAQISIPVPWKSPTAGLLYNDLEGNGEVETKLSGTSIQIPNGFKYGYEK